MAELYPYQIEYISDLSKNCIMAASVGLGKTIMALEHYKRNTGLLPKGYKYVDESKPEKQTYRQPLVVIAPASKVRTGDWQREIENFFKGYAPEYTVISYEMFSKKWKELVDENTTLIIDEMHMACNATTLRGKAVIGASRVAHQWIGLTATPLPNGWKSGETYAVMTGLARNKTEFVRRFVIIDRSRGFPLLLGYREEPLLEEWWASISKPLKRTGDLVLPSQSIAVTPDMQPKVAKEYRTALKERLRGEEELDSPSKLFSTLRRIPTPTRVDALHSILEGTDEHVVVFYNFNEERDAVLAMLAKSFKGRKLYEQSGHASDLPPREKWGKLKPSVTLVQYQSGSQAIELTYASITVYLSPCTSYSNYEQSLGRTRRHGQEKTVLFYHIAVEKSLDRHIWKILSTKSDFSTALINKTLANITIE